jgi:zona occludens toxin (predicted ATPase)
MTEIVISAPPRTGKTLKAVEIIDSISKKEPHRRIYTNIVGMNYPGVILIQSTADKPFDWRDLPNGAILIYDEAHEHPAFSSENLLKTFALDDSELILKIAELNTNDSLKVKDREEQIRQLRKKHQQAEDRAKEDILDIGRSLTLHGHFGIDIYLITQKPNLLNTYVRAACSEHLVLRRLFKLPMCTIYSYAEVQEHFGAVTRKNALSYKFWWYPKQLYKFYISAEEHNAKASLPFWIYGLSFLLIGILGMAILKTTNSPIYQRWVGQKEAQKDSQSQATQTQTQSKQSSNSNSPSEPASNLANSQNNLSAECRQAANLDKPECVKWFDDLSKNGSSVNSNGAVVQTVSYNPNKPYDFEYQRQVQPTDFPRMSGVMKLSSGKLIAVDQQGNYMQNVSQDDCKKWLSGYRPFNYFAQQKQSTEGVSTTDSGN